jgi:HK97 family phage major capsid protein
MDDDLKKVAEDLRSVWESELKPRIEQIEAETKSSGEAHSETKEAVDRVQDRLDELEVKLEKASSQATERKSRRARTLEERTVAAYKSLGWTDEAEAGFWNEIGAKNMVDASLEAKALALRDETLGGVLAPPEFVADVIKGIVQYSPVRDIANVRQTSRTSVQFPKRTGVLAAQWAAEVSTRTETTGQTYGLEEIPTHELYARVLISNWDLEDPVVDLEADVRASMEEQFGVAEGAAFVGGSGVNKPEGIIANVTGSGSADVEQVLNGAASFTSADGIIKLVHQLKEQYWADARFILNRFTLRDLRLLKDTTNNYLWQPGVLGSRWRSAPADARTALPVHDHVDMPGRAGRRARSPDRVRRLPRATDRRPLQISTLRDPYTQASATATSFHARKRVGGQVVLPEAIKILKMA